MFWLHAPKGREGLNSNGVPALIGQTGLKLNGVPSGGREGVKGVRVN